MSLIVLDTYFLYNNMLLICLIKPKYNFFFFLYIIGNRHWSSRIHKRAGGRYMHTTNTIAVDGYRLHYAQSCKPSLSCFCHGLPITCGYYTFRITAAQGLNWKYGHYISWLYDRSSNRQHCAHICRV